MCREGGGKVSPGVISLMNPGPYRPLYLWGDFMYYTGRAYVLFFYVVQRPVPVCNLVRVKDEV
jgi:hypothetical protein